MNAEEFMECLPYMPQLQDLMTCLDEDGRRSVIRMLTGSLPSSMETISAVTCTQLEHFDIGGGGVGKLRRVVYRDYFSWRSEYPIVLNPEVKQCISNGLIVTRDSDRYNKVFFSVDNFLSRVGNFIRRKERMGFLDTRFRPNKLPSELFAGMTED
ncbi:hypothetical protein BD410DRAFT_832508 [Rickenella mellea]|uniref:Uncharacterized protein n=1 Tax=Rickenella mellea TaxID=50990 RepID=A0A4Y7PM48_9AGAM|nr:hypothetical protein BD410DRAFT_832508 [Rickenella mellea]